MIGNPNIWDQSVTFHKYKSRYRSHTWSPCGQFIAALNSHGVEIHDSLTPELLSTLTESCHFMGPLAYSPNGHFLVCLSITDPDVLDTRNPSNTSLIIWDILTGGIAEELQSGTCYLGESLVWSLNGKKIGGISGRVNHTYNVTSGSVGCPE